jgi:hypothetical protein
MNNIENRVRVISVGMKNIEIIDMKKLLGILIWIISLPFKIPALLMVIIFGIFPFCCDGMKVTSDYINNKPFDPKTDWGSYIIMVIKPLCMWPFE